MPPTAKKKKPVRDEEHLIALCQASLEAKLSSEQQPNDELSDASSSDLMEVCRRVLQTHAFSESAAMRMVAGLAWIGGHKVSVDEGKAAMHEAARRVQEAAEVEAEARAAAALAADEGRPLQATQRVVTALGSKLLDLTATCAVECRLHGNGLGPDVAVKQPAEFTIEAYDATGRRKKEGGDVFFVSVRGAQRVRARVTDQRDGTYTCSWTPPQSGLYNIAVSCFGVPLPGSPFALSATPLAPHAPSCVVSGGALQRAVARATQSFEVGFRDRLGFTTAAVDLDVYVEALVAPLSRTAAAAATAAACGLDVGDDGTDLLLPTIDATGHARMASDDGGASGEGAMTTPAVSKVARVAASFGNPSKVRTARGTGNVSVAIEDDDGILSDDIGDDGDESNNSSGRGGSHAVVRERTLRVKVRQNPIVVRAAEDVGSSQVGVIKPGQYATVVMEKMVSGRIRGMVLMGSISRTEDVAAQKQAAAKLSTAASTTGDAPAAASTPARARDADAGNNSSNPPEQGGNAAATAQAQTADAATDSSETPSGGSVQVGWVTLAKGGKKFVTSRVRQSVTSRQLGREQWARRMATDRAAVAAKKRSDASPEGTAKKKKGQATLDPFSLAPKVSLELDADPSGIGFAYGGTHPGTLHAHGKLFDTHAVSYSIGLVGEYLLHVRLRQKGIALPGSPFKLTVVPNVAYAASCRLVAPAGGTILGLVGTGGDAGCSVSIDTFDVVGNRCIQGGASVTSTVLEKVGTKDGAKHVEVGVTDNDDGTYKIHWTSNVSGSYKVALMVLGEHISGSPATFTLNSVTPQLTKTIISGDGLHACTAGAPGRFRLRFYDQFDNAAVPGKNLKFGLALLQGRSSKDVASEDFQMECVDVATCEYEVTYFAKKDGAFDLHVWADDKHLKGEKNERFVFDGSPFHCAVAAGSASAEMSYVDGWAKESKSTDKHGKAVDSSPADVIVAGDTVVLRPQVCDGLGNTATLEEGSVVIRLVFPDGTSTEQVRPEANTSSYSQQQAAAAAAADSHKAFKFATIVKGGSTAYDIKHEATHAGPHEVHLLLNGTPIRGSPVTFDVAAGVPDVKFARLVPPAEAPLYSNRTYSVVLQTFDRFSNPVPHGGLAVAGRLQLIKSGVHDLTTLMPSNHTVEVEDLGNGSYHVHVTLLKIAASVKIIVNMDKNLPASGGELPAVTCTFVPEPKAGAASDAIPSTDEQAQQQQQPVLKPSTDGDLGALPTVSSPADNQHGSESNARLRAAGEEVVGMLHAASQSEGMRPKAVLAVAAEAFADAGRKRGKKKHTTVHA